MDNDPLWREQSSVACGDSSFAKGAFWLQHPPKAPFQKRGGSGEAADRGLPYQHSLYGGLPTALLQQVSIVHCKLSSFRPAAERETRSGAGRSRTDIRSSLRIPARGGASQGRWLRGGHGCRGRSPRPRRWRAPVRKQPACRPQRRSACRAHPFRWRCG